MRIQVSAKEGTAAEPHHPGQDEDEDTSKDHNRGIVSRTLTDCTARGLRQLKGVCGTSGVGLCRKETRGSP